MREWGVIAYNCIAASEILIALICIGRYVYLEPGLRGRKARVICAAGFLAAAAVLQVLPGVPEDLFSFLPVVFFAGHTVAARRKRRIRGIFLSLSVLGYLMGVVGIFYAVPYMLTGAYPEGGGWRYAVDVLFWGGAGILYWRRDQVFHALRLDEPFRTLGRWERNFLHGAGCFLFVAGSMLMAVTETGLSGDAARALMGFGSIAVLFLEISVVIMIQQENQKNYYQYMTNIGEHYLQAELEHFRVYREREEGIRRFRHDMKNHLICLRELAERGSTERVRSYIEELQENMEGAKTAISSGNEIADAVIGEKSAVAKSGGIEIRLDGRLPEELPVKATDLCVLFSNALDNALEALERMRAGSGEKTLGEGERWIEIRIRQQGQMLSLIFRNPAGSESIPPAGRTEKEDAENHGFGTLNMLYTTRKYRGDLRRRIEKEDGKTVFCLEILLFLSGQVI